MQKHDREHEYEDPSGDGQSSPGADPDQDDDPKTSPDGDPGERS